MSGTPKRISKQIKDFCKSITTEFEPLYVKIIPEPYAEQLKCFNNVESKIQKDGGSIQYGRAIWEWKNVLLQAEFHVVWKSSDGELIDITPQDTWQSRRILFLPDNSITWTGKVVDNIRLPLNDSIKLKEFVRLSELIYKAICKKDRDMNEFTEYIEQMSTRPNVKKNAVENFLYSVNVCETYEVATENLIYDSKIYKWNLETTNAIYAGIIKAQELGIIN